MCYIWQLSLMGHNYEKKRPTKTCRRYMHHPLRLNNLIKFKIQAVLAENSRGNDLCAIYAGSIHYKTIITRKTKSPNQNRQMTGTSTFNTRSFQEVSLKSNQKLLKIRVDKTGTYRRKARWKDGRSSEYMLPDILRGGTIITV